MRTYTVELTARVHAPATVAYGIIADYRTGHPHIIPPKYFRNLSVIEGGVGAGTRIRFEMGAMGVWRTVEADVTEPRPGELLEERIPAERIRTTFQVVPAGQVACDVTIATEFAQRGGVVGALERLTTSAITRRVYRDELALLDRVARERSGAE